VSGGAAEAGVVEGEGDPGLAVEPSLKAGDTAEDLSAIFSNYCTKGR